MGLLDPIIRGTVALCMKVVPQTIMAYKILIQGGGGISVEMIGIFHFLMILRIVILGLSIRQSGRDRNLLGILMAEIGNELSWCLVTLAWLNPMFSSLL